MKRLMAALCLVASLGFAQEKKLPEDVLFEEEVVYGKGAGQDLRLNLARPKGEEGLHPCILFIHGGGWRMGNKNGHNPQIQEYARKGWVSATIGYRFAPKYPFPAQIEDVKCAVRFLRANAEKYGIQKDRIGAVGFSAGAHLSMMLGTMEKEDGLEGEGGCPEESSKVNCVVAFFGPTDFTIRDWPAASHKIVDEFLGGAMEEREEICRRASPITYVKPGSAPTLLVQGTKDNLVPYTQATRMVEALAKAGVPGRLDLILGAGHGWGDPELKRTADETYAFFEQYLRPKKK